MYPMPRQLNDQELAKRVTNFLHLHQWPAASRIEVLATDGVVVLRGDAVPKQEQWLCIQYCQHVAGVMRVVDQLESPKTIAASRPRESYRAKRASKAVDHLAQHAIQALALSAERT